METQGRRKWEVIYGIQPVREALRSKDGRVQKLLFSEGRGGTPLKEILAMAGQQGIPVQRQVRADLDLLTRTRSHQGVAALIARRHLWELEDLVREVREKHPISVLLLLDSVVDPRNLGALLRSAEAFGVQGVISTIWRSAPLSSVVAKTAAGALEHLRISQVTNLYEAIRYLKEQGFWVIGAEAGAATTCDSWDFSPPTALVLGGEGKGLRPRVRNSCDVLLSIPLSGQLSSLNVAVAAGILFYEIWRQHNGQKKY